MKQETQRLGENGEVTLTASMRDAIGVEPGDKVVMRLKNGSVIIRPEQSIVEQLEDIGEHASDKVMSSDEAWQEHLERR